MNSPAELAAVRHLVDLGYEDPLDVAMRVAVEERGRQLELTRAQQLLNARQFGEGIAALERLADAAPEWPAPRRLLATANYQTGRLTAAIEHLDWLQMHAFEHAQLALMRAAIELARRNFDVALDQAEYASHLGRITPHLATAGPDVFIGEMHLRRGNLVAADEAFQRANRRWPTDAGALAGLAAVALSGGDVEASLDYALQALDNNMQFPLAHYRLGVGLVRLERYPEAHVAFETFARLSPHRAAPYRWLATTARMQGDAAKSATYREHGLGILRDRRASRAAHRATALRGDIG